MKTTDAPPLMMSGRPVWLAGRETEMNVTAGFRAVFDAPPGEPVFLNITASSRYRAWINGRFAGHGPARGPHGHARVDRWDVSGLLSTAGTNVVAVEVSAYNVNTYCTVDEPAFLQAEVVTQDDVLASTAGGGAPFIGQELPERVRRVERYSFQRGFSEAYRMGPHAHSWRNATEEEFGEDDLVLEDEKPLLPFNAPLPNFDLRDPVAWVSSGELTPWTAPENLWTCPRTTAGANVKAFEREKLATVPSQFLQGFGNASVAADSAAYDRDKSVALPGNSWRILDFGANRTGFVCITVSCFLPVKLYLTFDEILVDGDVDYKRLDCVNVVEYALAPGEYHLETSEPYTLRYVKIWAVGGSAKITGATLREVASPDAARARFECSDAGANRVFEAARETFRQNAVDIFMDCPSRERAGWLCDSMFTARAAISLSGHCKIEDNFIENYLLPQTFPGLPAGMLPMCYPADHPDGNYIPNWTLWFVLQLEEYARRGGNQDVVRALEPRVMAVFDYFKAFENSDGLLEKLPAWVFVEWSRANDLVQDVNFPTNMLYAGALDAAARLYNCAPLSSKATALRDTIREQSFDGNFFVDNATREEGVLTATGNRTETCQYYAFYFDVATEATYPALWKSLTHEFGPQRETSGAYPDISPSNALPGHTLRLELLSRYGAHKQVLAEICGYFAHMADLTGTLWEHDGTQASCNHGFASHVAWVMFRDVLGITEVDYRTRKVTLKEPDAGLEWCKGAMPVPGGGLITVDWRRGDSGTLWKWELPSGYEAVLA